MKIYIVVMDIVNDVTCSCKSGHSTFYYMTLSTGNQQCHMIKPYVDLLSTSALVVLSHIGCLRIT